MDEDQESSRKRIRLYFRNMKHINRRFRVDEPNLRQLNFIMVDLDLKMEKVETLTAEDVELLKALQAEKQDLMRMPIKEAQRVGGTEASKSPLAPEVQVVKHFKSLLQDDLRFQSCNVYQSTQLLKQDKILRSQIVSKLKEQIQHLNLSDKQLSTVLNFDVTDVDSDLEKEVVDTQEYFDLQQKSKQRDAIVDSLLSENAKLKLARDAVIYETLKLQIDNQMIKYEDLTGEQQHIFETQEAAAKILEAERADLEKKRKAARQEQASKQADEEFLRYAQTILF